MVTEDAAKGYRKSGGAFRNRSVTTPGFLLVGDGVAEDANARDFHLDDVARHEEARWVKTSSRAGGRPGGDDIAGLERGERRDVSDEVGNREEHVRGRVVLADFAVDARRDADGVERAELVRRRHPWANRAGLVEILARRDVELRVAQPVAYRALVHAGDACDVPQRLRGWNAAPPLANHNRDLSLVVELRRLGRPKQRSSVTHQRVASAHEDAGIARPLGSVAVLLVPVAIVDPHADNLLRRGHGRQENNLIQRVVRRVTRRDLCCSLQPISLEQVAYPRVSRPEPVA